MQEAQVWSLGWEDLLEKGMAIHSSILAWEISWTEKPGKLQFMGSQRVGYNWAANALRLTKRLMCAISSIGITMPPRHFGLIKEYSSLVLKGICAHGGVIDPDYQGEIWVILQNEEKNDLFINKHDQIA